VDENFSCVNILIIKNIKNFSTRAVVVPLILKKAQTVYIITNLIKTLNFIQKLTLLEKKLMVQKFIFLAKIDFFI